MSAMEPGLGGNLATKADIADLRTELHSQLRAQTWRLAGLVVAINALMLGIARLS